MAQTDHGEQAARREECPEEDFRSASSIQIIVRPLASKAAQSEKIEAEGSCMSPCQSKPEADLPDDADAEGPEMGDDELGALMAELELEVQNASEEEENEVRLECYKATIAGLMEGQTFDSKLATLDYYKTLIAPGDPDDLARQCLDHLCAVEQEQRRIAEEEGMAGGDLHVSLRLDGDDGNDAPQDELTVDQLKALVEQRRKIPSAHQRLVFAGTELRGSRTIRSYNIADGAVLFLVRRRPTGVRLNIAVEVSQTGQSVTLERVSADETLAALKSKIEEHAGILAANQVLVFAGELLLDDDQRLVDLGFGRNFAGKEEELGEAEAFVKLHLVLRR